MDVENIDEDGKRAEVFDALSHPTRIMLLKALSEEALGFADLKKKTGIESSGHLQHHINKLNGLVKTDASGKYILSDQGKDALYSVNTIEVTAGTKAGENKKPYNSRSNTVLKSTVAVLVVLLAISLTLTAFEYSNVLSLQSENSNFQNQITQLETQINELEACLRNVSNARKVYITQFAIAEWNNASGLLGMVVANVTVQNFGSYDVENLRLSVRHESLWDSPHTGDPVGLLKSGETQKVSVLAFWQLPSDGEIETFIATLMLDEIILDECTASKENPL